jgi:hypothetical protein
MVDTRSGGKKVAPKRNAVGKVKNKARTSVSAEDISPTSDEYNFSDEEDLSVGSAVSAAARGVASAAAAASASGIGYSSDTSQSSQRQKLPEDLLTCLVADIQGSGGIGAFHLQSAQSISVLCDKNPSVYGRRGNPLREKIRKKVNRWQKDYRADPNTWSKVLEKVGWEKVVSATKPTKPANVTTKKLETPTKPPVVPSSNIHHSISSPSASLIPSSGKVVNKMDSPCKFH